MRDAAAPSPAPAGRSPQGALPRPLHRPAPRYWWLQRRSYFFFVIREITSVFVAAYSIFLVFALFRLGQGPAAYAEFLALLATPLSITLHLVVLAFVLYHAVTWFNLTPKIMVLHRGEERVSPLVVAALVYGGWIAFSALLLFLVLRV